MEIPATGIAFCASALGAHCATLLPAHIFRPVIVVVLVAILIFTAFESRIPRKASRIPSTLSLLGRALAIGMILGGYDGVLGVGVGSMMLVAFQVLLGYNFLHATAAAKVLNSATDLGALIYFIPLGSIHWLLGILMGCANMAGNWVGARTAIHLGEQFIRRLLIIIVTLILLRLTAQILGWV